MNISMKPMTDRNWTVKHGVPADRQGGKYKLVNDKVDTMCFILEGIPYSDVFNTPLTNGGDGSVDRMLKNLSVPINPLDSTQRTACLEHLKKVADDPAAGAMSFRRLYTGQESDADAVRIRAIFTALRAVVPEVCTPFIDIPNDARPGMDAAIDDFVSNWGTCDLYTLYATSKKEILDEIRAEGTPDEKQKFIDRIGALKSARTAMVIDHKPNDRICDATTLKCKNQTEEWCSEAEDGYCALASG